MSNFDPRECIFYHIYPLGFCDAPKLNENNPPVNRINAIEKWIPHMKNLGVSALYLGPVFDSGCHGYDTHDYTKIDPRLGTNEDFAHFCRELKANGIHLVLDGVFNHVGRGFFAFADVKTAKNQLFAVGFRVLISRATTNTTTISNTTTGQATTFLLSSTSKIPT